MGESMQMKKHQSRDNSINARCRPGQLKKSNFDNHIAAQGVSPLENNSESCEYTRTRIFGGDDSNPLLGACLNTAGFVSGKALAAGFCRRITRG